jgi:hypothetical protein
VTFDLTQTPDRAGKPQEFMQMVTAVAEVGGEEIKVPMVAKGTMEPAYRLSANRLDLGAVLAGRRLTRSAEVEPLGPGPYDKLEVLSVPEGFTASAEKVEGGKSRMSVTSPPGLQELIWRERVEFRAVKGGEPFAAGTVCLWSALRIMV